jgi:hypothetical protein
MPLGTVCGEEFAATLSTRREHLDNDIIRDVTPLQNWVANTISGEFPPYAGVSHTFTRMNRIMPDLSGCWKRREEELCEGTPCDPDTKEIGMGYTRDGYFLEGVSYDSDLICFDQTLLADQAEEQYQMYIENLRDATVLINNNRVRTQALLGCGRKIVASAPNGPQFTFTTNADCTKIRPSAFPQSILTIQLLQRQYERLKLNGYFGKMPEMSGMAQLVTDDTTAWNLLQGNATDQNLFRFTDWAEGGRLWKYGITNAVGNFGIRYDDHSLRYQKDPNGLDLDVIYPYTNVPATAGIKGDVNQAYIDAPYQIDFIWHPKVMEVKWRQAKSVNPMMPFLNRSYAGDWRFVMDNLTKNVNGVCTPVDNTRRNKGKFIADWENAVKWTYREYTMAILTQRQQSCVVNVPTCSPQTAYVYQNYNSANDVCPLNTLCFTPSGNGPYTVNGVTCNGSPVTIPASGLLTDIDAVVNWLNANVSSMGAWSLNLYDICLNDTTCTSATLDVSGT